MTPAEAAVLLAAISANDNREVTESASRAWAAALPDVDLADALEILPSYYRDATRDTRNWIYPGDVLERARELYKARVAEAGKVAEMAWIKAYPDGDPDNALGSLRARIDGRKEYERTHQAPGMTRKEIEAADVERRRNEDPLGWAR